MKKFISVIFAAAFIVLLSVTAFAAGSDERLFISAAKDEVSYSELSAYAAENGFTGIVLDCRGGDYSSYVGGISAGNGESAASVWIFCSGENAAALAEKLSGKGLLGGIIVDISEASSISGTSFGEAAKAVFVPFGTVDELSAYSETVSGGGFDTVFVENLLSCYSDEGYEVYLKAAKSAFKGADIITVNDLSRVLVPVVSGDFYGDPFELNLQYLVNGERSAGFCVSDYSALLNNSYGSAAVLTEFFGSTVLKDYAGFSISQKFEITRPTTETLKISTAKYTIFGTSDPSVALYMNGTEIERISSSGLFAVNVEVPKTGKTFTFTQGGESRSVTLTRTSTGSGTSSTISKITSGSPTVSLLAKYGETLKLSCVAPSGGTVYAVIDGQKVELTQKASADDGIPSTFSAEFTFTGKGGYPDGELTSAGKVKYVLSYNGEETSFTTVGEVFVAGEGAALIIKANCNLCGVEAEPVSDGAYLTTLRTGCLDYVTESLDGWYKVSSGGYIKASQADFVTGAADCENSVSVTDRVIGEGFEKLVLKCSNLPYFKGEINGKRFSITLYNTEWSDFALTDTSSVLMYRINPVDNGDGSITINFFSKNDLWGWDVFTDEEAVTFTIALKQTPKLSGDPALPMKGLTVALCAGHGGPDPGALSVAGETGVTEAQINLAHVMAMKETFESLGADIVLLVSDGSKLDTYGRTDPAREALVDIYVCCHSNSVAENADANLWCGTEVYYHYPHSAEFSQKLTDYISSATKRDNEGSKQDYYSVTRLTICPAVMLEIGFVSNPSEVEGLIDKENIQKTAFAVAKAVMEVLDN